MFLARPRLSDVQASAYKKGVLDGKIAGNRERDSRVLAKLSAMGWKTLVIWECMLRGPARRPVEQVLDRVADWLRGDLAESSI